MSAYREQGGPRTVFEVGDRAMFHGRADMVGTVVAVFDDTIQVVLDEGGMVRSAHRNWERVDGREA